MARPDFSRYLRPVRVRHADVHDQQNSSKLRANLVMSVTHPQVIDRIMSSTIYKYAKLIDNRTH